MNNPRGGPWNGLREAVEPIGRALRTVPRPWVLALGALALAVRIPLIMTSGRVAYSGDAVDYLRLADELAHARFPSTYRMPGYPLLFAAMGPLPGSRAAAVVTAQHLIGVALVCIVVVAGRRFFDCATAVTAGLLAALTPVMLGLEHTLEPDFLFGAIALTGACAVAEALARPRPSNAWLAAAGVAFGVACYVKPVGVVLPAAAVVALLFATRSVRASLRGAAAVAGVTTVLVVPWVIRNQVDYGVLTLSDQGGQTLFKRVFEVDRRPIPLTTPDGRLVARIVRAHGPADRTGDLNDYLATVLRRSGLSPHQAVTLEGRVARTAIAEDPSSYVLRTVPLVWRELNDVDSFSSADLAADENSSSLRPGHASTLVAAAIDLWFWPVRVLATVWWIASLSAFAALLVLRVPDRRPRAAGAALLSVWLAVALATALTHGGHRRYSAQVAPEVWLVASAGAVMIVRALAPRLHHALRTA